MRPLTPELEFVTRLARVRAHPADVERARTLAAGPLAWSRVAALAAHHGLVGLVHHQLADRGVAVPSAVAEGLKRAAISDAAGNLAKFARWTALCRRFEREGLKTVHLKGFHVALSIYGDLSRRPVGDLDILVAESDVPRALEVLALEGYYLTRRWSAAVRNVGFAYALRHAHEMQLGASDRLSVDLHWRVGPRGLARPTAELFAAARPFDAQGTTVLAPTPGDAVAMLILHGYKSRWHRFRWVVDVAEGLAALNADERARMRAHLDSLGMVSALTTVEQLIAGTWTTEIPVRDATAAQRRELQHLRRVHERHHDVHQTHDWKRPARLLQERFAEHRSAWTAVRAAATPSHQDWAAARLPTPLRAGYIALRPFRILGDAAARWRSRRAAGVSGVPESRDDSATFVTAIYSSGPDSVLGGRGRGLAFYVPTLRNLASFGSPLVVFASAVDVPSIREALGPMFPRLEVIPFELSEFEFFQPFLSSKATYRDSLRINDRNEVLCFLKSYWLARVSAQKPWGSAHTYWIDAGLFHHGIFPERVGGVEQLAPASPDRFYPLNQQNIFAPRLREAIVDATPRGRLFCCAMTTAHAMFSAEHLAALTGAEPGAPVLSIREHVVGGIFGGHDEDVQRFFIEFRRLLHRAIALHAYTLEEQLFSVMHAMHPDWFATQRFDTWYFYAPGEPCGVLEADAESFFKIFTRLAARVPT